MEEGSKPVLVCLYPNTLCMILVVFGVGVLIYPVMGFHERGILPLWVRMVLGWQVGM